MRKGFTLVELSIVLVIIGLLIGAILVAQSMIGTAKIQGVVRQIQQYDVAVSNFKTKFGGWPGDLSTVNPNYGTSKDDGKIDIAGGGFIDSDWATTEAVMFWVNLQESGLTIKTEINLVDADENSFQLPAVNGYEQAMIVPMISVLSEAGTCNDSVGGYNCGAITNIYQISNTPITAFVRDTYPTFTTAEALAIDQKMDDGKPEAGNVRGSGEQPCTVDGYYDSATTYDMTQTGAQCEMGFVMLSQVGQAN